MIAGTSMNETQAIDREESEHTTGEAIMAIDVNRTDAQNGTDKSEKEITNEDHEKEYTRKRKTRSKSNELGYKNLDN